MDGSNAFRRLLACQYLLTDAQLKLQVPLRIWIALPARHRAMIGYNRQQRSNRFARGTGHA